MKDFSDLASPIITLAGVLSAGAAIVGWSYETFEPKQTVKERSELVERRLERIENKIDLLFERVRK